MTHQNRVDPRGQLRADPERGLLFGNRGVLHDREGRMRRARTSEIRWIICVTEWKDRRRQLLRPGHYTELFFLDEATALAAGHRPCAECRRAEYRAFLAAIGDAAVTGAVALDRRLETERWRPTPLEGTTAALAALPDGAFLDDGDRPLLLTAGRLHPWTAAGYEAPLDPSARTALTLLTPPTTVAALRGGYRPVLHPSARG